MPTFANGITRTNGAPVEQLQQWLGKDSAAEHVSLLLVDFEFSQYWHADNAPLALTAIYCRVGAQLFIAVTDVQLQCNGTLPRAQFDSWVDEAGLYVICQGRALPLAPVVIAKPWGRELWFTGVEQRGVSAVGGDGASVPLPWLMAVLPLAAATEPLLLLKLLEPHSESVRGDLYFELHREKREVYVVTHVDEKVWPDGIGYLRYGFDAAKLAQYPDEHEFRQGYLSAVRSYESVRRAIDAVPPGAVVDATLLEREVGLRRAMEDFTHLRPVVAGDVITVPLMLPHALQHGVRTVEFQTPVYERQILSFAQRVVTQEHWDTASVVDQMRLLAPPDPAPLTLQQGPALLLELVAQFDDFEVRRLTIGQNERFFLQVDPAYCLLMVIKGQIELDGQLYQAEQAALLPADWRGQLAALQPAPELVLLLALPCK